MITLHHFELTKKQLDSIPESERVLIILLCHAANELAVLTKMFHFCSAYEAGEEEVLIEARNAQALVMGRLLTGKLFEFWSLLQESFFSTKVSKEYALHFDADTIAALDNLKRYFGRNNLIKKVRNNFAFHYSSDQIKEGYGQLGEDDSLDVYLSKTNANSLYSFAESIAGRSLMESISPGDHVKAYELLIVETSKVIKWINEFIGGCVSTSLKLHVGGDLYVLGAKEIQIEGAEDWKSVTIPYFVETEEDA